MYIIIRKDTKISRKLEFILNLINQNYGESFFTVFKDESEPFIEKWNENNVKLASSIVAIIWRYLLYALRSPSEYRDAFIRRVSSKKPSFVFGRPGFLSALRQTLYLQLNPSARVNLIMNFINSIDSSRIFFVDEFFSINCLDLKKLKSLGFIIYISQDIAYKRYDFAGNSTSEKIMFRFERNAIPSFDLVIACSEAERLNYLEMGAKKAIFYPNMYPTEGFKPEDKDEMPSISVILREHWGSKARKSLETIFNAIGCLNCGITVHLMGIKPETIPKNVKLEYHEFVKSKTDFLKIVSKSWIGINIGIHKAGTNERKYDYAEAGVVVISDALGARGDLLPHEYTYIDRNDLAAKIRQLLELGKPAIKEMGKNNRTVALSLAEKNRQIVIDVLDKMTTENRQVQ